MSVFVPDNERVQLARQILLKFEQRCFKTRGSLKLEDYNTSPTKYTDIVLDFEAFIKDNRPLKHKLSQPREKFFVKLFTGGTSSNFNELKLNTCYLYAFGKNRHEVLFAQNQQDTMKKTTNTIEDDILNDYPYKVQLAQKEDLKKIFSISDSVYSGIDVIPYSTIKSWYEKNPFCFYVITNVDNLIKGYISVLPLKEGDLSRLIKGDIIESEITSDSIFAPYEKEYIKNFHVESVVNNGGRVGLIELMKVFPDIVLNFIDRVSLDNKIYCVAASKHGIRFIRHLGFTMVDSGENRKDGHEFYERNVCDVLRSVAQIISNNNKYSEAVNKIEFLLNI